MCNTASTSRSIRTYIQAYTCMHIHVRTQTHTHSLCASRAARGGVGGGPDYAPRPHQHDHAVGHRPQCHGVCWLGGVSESWLVHAWSSHSSSGSIGHSSLWQLGSFAQAHACAIYTVDICFSTTICVNMPSRRSVQIVKVLPLVCTCYAQSNRRYCKVLEHACHCRYLFMAEVCLSCRSHCLCTYIYTPENVLCSK